ncbi:MAG: aldehyde dehydrogenase [Microbacteriaceae bacterium]|nr:aldehyde dehydrogenase [Microbacteriaceae bacterium]
MTTEETPSAEFDAILDRAAQAAPTIAATTPRQRAEWLDRAADALDANAAILLPLAIEESHLTEDRLTGELRRTTFQLRLFGEVIREGAFLQATIDHADPDWPMGARPDLRRMMRPLGPVAVFAASNFPFAFSVAGGDTASAIAAGCPVVVKLNPGHPRLSRRVGELVASAMQEAGAPTGTLALVSGMQTGRALVLDPRITAASFTGSLAGGRALFDLATSRPDPIPFYGELGSVNPAFVTEQASLMRAEDIATGFVGSVSMGVGQFCTKPGLLFVPAGSAIPGIAARVAAERSGAAMLNERIREGYGTSLGNLAAHPEVTVLAGSADPGIDPAPTLLLATAKAFLASDGALATESFGPTGLIVSYESDEELLAAAESFEGQLTATVQGEGDETVVPALLAALADRAGRVLWNGWPTGVSVTYAMQHGGPYPATTASQGTSVGTTAIDRFLRPVSYQGVPDALLPAPVRDGNPWSLPRRIDGRTILPS